jgi:hypothetical protein
MLSYKNVIGINNELWVMLNLSIDNVIKKCWQLLPIILVIKLLYEFIIGSGTNSIEIREYIRTAVKTILIAFFLAYYKEFLMLLDSTIEIFSDLDTEYKKALAFVEKVNLDNLANMSNVKKMMHYPFLILSKSIGELNQLCSLLTHQGSIILMDSLKSVILLIISYFGPISAIISILPGAFGFSFRTWLLNYINISCWSITLTILQKMVNVLNLSNNFAPISIALLLAIFLTPLWTSMFLNNTVNWSATLLKNFSSQVDKSVKYIKKQG